MAAQSQGATAPTVFQFQESTQLRVITIDGESWFVALMFARRLALQMNKLAVLMKMKATNLKRDKTQN